MNLVEQAKRIPPARMGLALLACLVGSGALFASPAWAASEGSDINFAFLTMRLLGGLAIFLYGMEKMGEALKMVAGERMKEILGKLTTNRFMGMITGLVVTAIIQSSSVTTVMLVGFVTADLMSLSQAIGVILGADIGTTVTAQIVAFKVTKFASLLIAGGFIMAFVGRTETIKQYGHLVLGLGLIFFGMGEMSNAMKPLRTYEPFMAMMQNVSNPVIGIMVSALFTGLIQSSSATMGVVVALAMQGLINLEAGIALALGANIGTCMTAGLAAIGKPREAVRVAVAHVTFKVVGVALAVFFIPHLAEFVRSISPAASAAVTGLDKLAFETPRQVANAHTIFNVVMAVVFLPIGGLFARFCEMVVPDGEAREETPAGIFQPQFLDESLLSTPAIALSMVRQEMEVMSVAVDKMISAIPDALFAEDKSKIPSLREMDDEVDRIHAAITQYLGEINSQNLSAHNVNEVMGAMVATNEMESIGDIIENNLAHLAEAHAESPQQMSDEMKENLLQYFKEVQLAFRRTTAALISGNSQAAETVIAMKDSIQFRDAQCVAHQMSILQEGRDEERMGVLLLQADIRENLKRIYYHAKRIAKVVTRTDDAAPWFAQAGEDVHANSLVNA